MDQITEGAKNLDSAMAEVNSNPSNASTIVQLTPPLSLDRGIDILMTEEDLLRASNVLPLPSSLQEELLHNNLLSEEDRLKLAEQGKKQLFPIIQLTGEEKVIFFLNCFVSSEHPLGSKILDLGKT